MQIQTFFDRLLFDLVQKYFDTVDGLFHVGDCQLNLFVVVGVYHFVLEADLLKGKADHPCIQID